MLHACDKLTALESLEAGQLASARPDDLLRFRDQPAGMVLRQLTALDLSENCFSERDSQGVAEIMRGLPKIHRPPKPQAASAISAMYISSTAIS